MSLIQDWSKLEIERLSKLSPLRLLTAMGKSLMKHHGLSQEDKGVIMLWIVVVKNKIIDDNKKLSMKVRRSHGKANAD